MNSIECTKQKIRAVIAGSKVPEDTRHAENTLYWLLRLKPDADEKLTKLLKEAIREAHSKD